MIDLSEFTIRVLCMFFGVTIGASVGILVAAMMFAARDADREQFHG